MLPVYNVVMCLGGVCRDTFCKMMKDWEERHDFTDWSLEDRCGPEIQRMFHGADLANYLHFSRLFVSQLIEVSTVLMTEANCCVHSCICKYMKLC